jgi:hypothetical protein
MKWGHGRLTNIFQTIEKDIIEVIMNTIPNLTASSTNIKIQLLLTAIGALGVPAIILPFAFDYSPLAAASIYDLSLWRLSWPFFLPVLVIISTVRWIFLKKYSITEMIVGYIVSAAILCVTFSGYVTTYHWADDTQSQIAFISPFVILFFGVFVVLKNWKKLVPMPGRTVTIMQIAYLANCSLCLIGFIDKWQVGAYFSLATAIAYLVQVILLSTINKH